MRWLVGGVLLGLLAASAGCQGETDASGEPNAGASGTSGTSGASGAAGALADAALPEDAESRATDAGAEAAPPAAGFAAEPGVTLTGDGTHGGKVVVTASVGFGDKPASSWKAGHDLGLPLLWDRIDNRPSYAGLADGALVPVGDDHPFDENAGVRYRKNLAPRHAYDDAHYQTAGGNSWLGHPRDLSGGKQQTPADREQLFVSWWVKFEAGPYENENNGSHKFVRVWSGDNLDLRVSWTQRQITCTNGNAGGSSAIASWAGPGDWPEPGEWVLHEIWVSADDGRIQAWVNGKRRHDWSSQDPSYLLGNHVGKLDLVILGWNPSHGTAALREQAIEMDDIWVDDTRARVVLYAGQPPFLDQPLADHRTYEIQPTSSWSDSSIEFELNAGAFGALGGKRLAVVRHDGSVVELGAFASE